MLGATAAYAVMPARTGLKSQDRILLGAIAAIFPDSDFAGFLIDPLSFVADWHQGPTHSLVLLPAWALLIAGAFIAATRLRGVFMVAACVSALGLASHIAADLITVYGTAVLYPLSAARWSLGTTFLIDPVFSGIILFGLVLGVGLRRRRFAMIGLAGACLYVGAQAWLQQHAIEAGRLSAREHGLVINRLTALPQPLSPFNWKLVGRTGPVWFVAHVDLSGQRPWLPPMPYRERLIELAGAYRPPEQLAWRIWHRYGDHPELREQVEQLWSDPRFAKFRRFAVYPSLSRIDQAGAETCIWFTDLRYDLPTLPDMFRYGFCRDSADRPWELYRLRYFTERARQRLAP